MQEIGLKDWRTMTRDELKNEFLKSKRDPVYFIKNYIQVEHQLLGLVNFDLFPFQEKIIKDLETHRFNITKKFRQAGATTIAAAYALWTALFKKNKTIVILSIGDTESVETLERVKLMYSELPKFLRVPLDKGGFNKHKLKLTNGSQIKSRPSKITSGRGLSCYLLIVDEAAFIEKMDQLWTSIYPVLSTGGRAFIISTVNGMGNWYYEMYTKTVEGRSEFNLIDIKWQDHPQYYYNKDYEWMYAELTKKDPNYNVHNWEKSTRANISLKQWLQEYEGEFLGTGETYVDSEIIRILNENVNDNYFIRWNNKMRVWKEPEPHYTYVIGVDTALGRDRDHSAFHIINAYNGEQVAEFYSNKTPIDEFAKIIYEEGNRYNTALVLFERNTIGNNLKDNLFNLLAYENLWMDEKGLFGFQTTTQSREQLLVEMEEALRNKKVFLNSKRTVEELQTFVISDTTNKPEAEEGKYDDLVMSLALTVLALNQVIKTTPNIISSINENSNEVLVPIINKSINAEENDYSWV